MNLGLEFPNLPYLIAGDFKLSESSAINNYIIRKSNKQELLGKTSEDQARIEMICSLFDDIFQPTYSLFFSPVYEKEGERLFNGKIKEKLQQLSKFVGDKNTILDYLTLADFKIAEASYYFEKLYKDNYKLFPFLARIRNTINELPEVKKYYSSDNAIKEPFLPSYAQLKL